MSRPENSSSQVDSSSRVRLKACFILFYFLWFYFIYYYFFFYRESHLFGLEKRKGGVENGGGRWVLGVKADLFGLGFSFFFISSWKGGFTFPFYHIPFPVQVQILNITTAASPNRSPSPVTGRRDPNARTPTSGNRIPKNLGGISNLQWPFR